MPAPGNRRPTGRKTHSPWTPGQPAHRSAARQVAAPGANWAPEPAAPRARAQRFRPSPPPVVAAASVMSRARLQGFGLLKEAPQTGASEDEYALLGPLFVLRRS